MTLTKHFVEITDLGREYLIEHKLIDVIVIAIYATICGADGLLPSSVMHAKQLSELIGKRKISYIGV